LPSSVAKSSASRTSGLHASVGSLPRPQRATSSSTHDATRGRNSSRFRNAGFTKRVVALMPSLSMSIAARDSKHWAKCSLGHSQTTRNASSDCCSGPTRRAARIRVNSHLFSFAAMGSSYRGSAVAAKHARSPHCRAFSTSLSRRTLSEPAISCNRRIA
jgi:hypothetical protein